VNQPGPEVLRVAGFDDLVQHNTAGHYRTLAGQPAGKDGTPADLKVKDYVLVMGDVDSQNNMTAKRLLVVTKPETDKRRAIMGTVTKSTVSSITLVTLNTKETWTIRLTSTTGYTAKTKASDVKVDTRIVTLGTVTGTNTMNALVIHLVPAASATPSPAAQ